MSPNPARVPHDHRGEAEVIVGTLTSAILNPSKKNPLPHSAARIAAGLAAVCLLGALSLYAPTSSAQDTPPAPAITTTTTAGTIHGTVKANGIPLPGVAITATNTLTGKKYATTTDLDGSFAMSIPGTGRYVVRAELAAFASATSEVKLTAAATSQTAEFTLQLASRVAQAQAATDARSAGLQNGLATALARGTQALSISGEGGLSDASLGGAAAAPSLGLGAETSGAGSDSVAVSGAQGQTNGLANLSEDQIRDRISEATDEARRRGGSSNDQVDAVVSLLGGILAGPGGGPGGGRGGGGRGGGGFRGFNPTQPHGSVFYQGGFSQLDAQAFSLSGIQTVKPNSYQNRFGVTFAGSPSIPGLLKASTKQFVFLNVTGQRNITPENLYATVPTQLERNGDFSLSGPVINGIQQNPTLYDPTTGALTIPGQSTGGTCQAAVNSGGNPGTLCAGHVVPVVTPQAAALLAYYPLPNVPNTSTRNFQNVTTQGTNTTNASARYVRNLGAGGGFPGFGGGRSNRNQPATLHQNINGSFSYTHNAADIRNFIPILGGKTASDGYGLSAGYSIGYGRLNNNATLTWNRSHTLQTNYFTYAPADPASTAGITIPSQAAALAQPGFYNGIPNISVTSYTGLSEVQPRDAINQTISFSDVVSYQRHKHNIRLGLDIRRVHADQVGGNNVVGTFAFSGLSTESPADQALTLNNSLSTTTQPTTGLSLADLEFGLPQETKIQAGKYKTYLRENVYDGYAQDDFRATANVSLNYGLRYEYFGPYTEKNGRLVNLDHNADFTIVDPVFPGGTGQFLGAFPTSLVNPDRTMFSPRFGVAWKPRFLKDTVVRAGYGINFNTGQYATFAQSLAFQPPFATTQNNVLATVNNATGCNLARPGAPSNLTLANGFNCATKTTQNTYAVDKNYRLGHVQVYNLDIQKTLPRGIVVNVGYNGSKGGNLDIVTAPNSTATTVTTPTAQAFTYEDSVAESRLQQLVISARKRLEKGISLQVVYQYGHSIDNASSIGGSAVSQVQNSARLDLEEGNSSFDVRHQVTGNYVLELPFGPGRAFFNKGGITSRLVDGFGFSGSFTFATGTYFTPQYQNTTAQLASGGTYTLRPDRVFTQPISGSKTQNQFFNTAAFVAPANGFGTASRNSIEGPGTVSYNAALSRNFSFGGTKSFEARISAVNAFNTVHYSSIDTTINSGTYGQVTGTAQQRQITLLGRYRF